MRGKKSHLSVGKKTRPMSAAAKQRKKMQAQKKRHSGSNPVEAASAFVHSSIPELQDPLARAQQRNAERRQKGRNGKRGPAAGPRQGEGDSEDEEEDAEFDFERRPRSSRDFTGMEEGGLPIKTAHGIMHMPHVVVDQDGGRVTGN
mgnify:FL=1